MSPSVLLIASLALWYVVAMVIFWHCLWEQKREGAVRMEVPLTLKEGQTVVGVEETAQAMEFYIDESVNDAKYYDL